MRKILVPYIHVSIVLAFLAMILVACGGGDGSGPTTISPPTPSVKSVVITGTVPGTVAIAYDYATGMEAARDVASGTPKTFALSVDPGTYYLMFIENEGTPDQRVWAFQNVTGGNVFTFEADTTLDLGVIRFHYDYPGGAVPQVDPISGNDKVTETFMPEASFSPGDGEWTATRTFVNHTCSGHSPGTTVTENVQIAQGYGLVTFTPEGTNQTAVGVANVNTAILTANYLDLETIYLTMQPDGSLAGSFSIVYGAGCYEEGTITAVRGISPPPAPATTLTGLSVNGPSSMPEYGMATYSATANWSDGSTTSVTPNWGVSPQVAEISTGGVLSCSGGIDNDQTVAITATYTSGGITKTATMNVTVTRAPSTYIPFIDEELSGKAFFQSRGSHSSLLYKLNADSSLEMYLYVPHSLGDRGYYITGTWSNDPDAGLDLDFRFADMGPYTVQRLADSSTEMEVEIYEYFWGSHFTTWEKTVPVDPSLLPGTYEGSDSYTWVFHGDGSGTVSSNGGGTFAWSVDSDGLLRIPSSTGYSNVLFARATSQSTATGYTILKVGIVGLTPSGDFFKYYGGYELTRQ